MAIPHENCSCVHCKRARRDSGETVANSVTSREIKIEGEATDAQVKAAMAVLGFNQRIAQGLQGIVDAANGPGNYATESLPHYVGIETAAASAALAIESTLPRYKRVRTNVQESQIIAAAVLGILVAFLLAAIL